MRLSLEVGIRRTRDKYEIGSEIGSLRSEVSSLASGVYIYQIMVKNEKGIPVFSDIKKMICTKVKDIEMKKLQLFFFSYLSY